MVAYLNRKAVIITILFLSIVLLIPFVQAEQNAVNYFADAVDAFDDEKFEQAIAAVNKAIELDPSNLEYQYYLGLIYTRLERDEEALAIFNAIVNKDPVNYFKAYFDISAIYTKQLKYQKAIDTLNLAEKSDPKSARVYLEKGYAYKNIKDYDRALSDLNQAKTLDPKLSQMATYDIAAIYFEKEEFDRALELFQQANEMDPATPLAEAARRAITTVKAAQRARKPWYLIGSFAWAYDSNVPLDPLEMIAPRPGPVQDREDQFQTFLAKAGYKFINQKDLEVGAGYSLYCIGYKEWFQNNVLSHTPYLFFQYSALPVIFRMQYDFSYYYAGGESNGQDHGLFLTFGDGADDKLRMHSITPIITILEPYNLKSEFLFIYQNKHYLDGFTPGASHYAAGIIQSYKFPQAEWYPRIGYKYGEENADRDDSTYRYHEGQIGLSASLFWKIVGDISATHIQTNYQSRRDKTYLFSLSLNRIFYDSYQFQLLYNHTRNRSNWVGPIDPHKFKKHIYYCSLTFMF